MMMMMMMVMTMIMLMMMMNHDDDDDDDDVKLLSTCKRTWHWANFGRAHLSLSSKPENHAVSRLEHFDITLPRSN